MLHQHVDEVYLLGDQISRVPWHNEVMDIAAVHNWQAIYGNHELIIGRLYTPAGPPAATNRDRLSALYWTQETLHPAHLNTIRALPENLIIRQQGMPPIHLTHGIPGNAFAGIFPNSADEWLESTLHGVAEPLVIVGHTHRPLDRTYVPWRIINGGAVGLPFNGDTRAQYVILEERNGAWHPIFRQVCYDLARVERAFTTSGMLDATGAYGALHLLTVMTALPWSSDFAWWHGQQPRDTFASIEAAIATWRLHYGPGRWAFPEPLA